ncbi:hypothetical protein Tco_0329255 [Tanacetum coccineum]
MASESTSSQQSSQLIPSSKVNFRCTDSIIGFNNVVALLEHSNELFRPILSFLSNCYINKALTLQPNAMYGEYLKEFWYTTEVEEETKTITFLLSWCDEPLSFTQDEFISAIGLPVCKEAIPLPPKETVRAVLATLGLFDKEKPTLSSTTLVNSSPLKMKEVNADDTTDKSSSRTSMQLVTQPKATTDRMTKKMRIPPSSKPKSPHKVRVILPKKQASETQHAKVTVATADTTKSLASETTEEQGNQPSTAEAKKVLDQNVEEEKDAEFVSMEEVAEEQSKEIPTVKQLLDEVDKQSKTVQETPESPYDTWSAIKVVKSYFASHIPHEQDPILHDSDKSADVQEDSEYESMPEDDLRSVSGFEAADSDNTQGNDMSHSDHIFQDDNAFVECLSLPDHMDHICEEVSSLHSKLGDMESFIIHQVLAEIKSSLPALVTTALQAQLPGLLSATLKECLPSILQASLFARLETELSKTLKSEMGKSMTSLVKSGMKESLLESAVIIDDTTEGEKTKKANDVNTAATQGEHQSVETLVKSQEEQPADVKVANKESAPSASDNKPSEGKELVVHNFEKKKSEGIISVEDDSDEDDKQPLSKRFKVLTPIPDIPNPTPMNTFVPEHLLKSKEQQKSMQEFTDQLLKTTFSKFSSTPPREPTPPKDSSKGKAVAIIEEPGNKLVQYQEEGGSNLKAPKLKPFTTPEGPLSQEEFDKQIKELKRIIDLKAEKEKSEQELRKLLNPATLKAQA